MRRILLASLLMAPLLAVPRGLSEKEPVGPAVGTCGAATTITFSPALGISDGIGSVGVAATTMQCVGLGLSCRGDLANVAAVLGSCLPPCDTADATSCFPQCDNPSNPRPCVDAFPSTAGTYIGRCARATLRLPFGPVVLDHVVLGGTVGHASAIFADAENETRLGPLVGTFEGALAPAGGNPCAMSNAAYTFSFSLVGFIP